MAQGLVQGGLSGQAGPYLPAQQGHVLFHLVGVGIGEARGIFAELACHAGHDHLLHPVAGGDAQTVGDEVPDADEGAFRPAGQPAPGSRLGAPAGAEDHPAAAAALPGPDAQAHGLHIGGVAVGPHQPRTAQDGDAAFHAQPGIEGMAGQCRAVLHAQFQQPAAAGHARAGQVFGQQAPGTAGNGPFAGRAVQPLPGTDADTFHGAQDEHGRPHVKAMVLRPGIGGRAGGKPGKEHRAVRAVGIVAAVLDHLGHAARSGRTQGQETFPAVAEQHGHHGRWRARPQGLPAGHGQRGRAGAGGIAPAQG